MKQAFKIISVICVSALLAVIPAIPLFSGEEMPATGNPADNSEASQYLEKLSRGFSNAFYGPLEIVYQLKEEVNRSDPLRGVVPGLVKGVFWFCMRETVGVYEMLTFYVPQEPSLKSFDVDWLHA